MNKTPLQRVLRIAKWFAGLSAVYWAAIVVFCGAPGFPLDDAFIHLQFARNLFEDGQMAFNKGVPSSGSSAPGFAALLAAFYFVTRDWYLASYLLGALTSLGTALVVFAILRSWTRRDDVAELGGLLTVAMHPTIVQAYAGMETSAYSLVFLLGLAAYGKERTRLFGSTLFALNVWLRPEMLLMWPLTCAERLFDGLRRRERLSMRLRECALHSLIWVAMLGLYVSYHWHQDRHFLPSTFAAKATAHYLDVSVMPTWIEGLPSSIAHGRWTHAVLAISVWPLALVVSTVLGLGLNCLPIASRLRSAVASPWRGDDGDDGTAASRRLACLALVAFPLARGAVDPIGVFIFQFQRYYAHLTPLAVLLVLGSGARTEALSSAPEKAPDPRIARLPRVAMAFALGGSVLQAVLAVGGVSNINHMQVAMGKWLSEHSSPEQLIAVNDIGAIAFFSERRIVDMVGLTEPAIVKHHLAGGSIKDYLVKKQPAYVVIFPWWYPGLSEDPALRQIHSIKLELNFVCGGSEMVVFRTDWDAGP